MSGDVFTTEKLLDYSFKGIVLLALVAFAASATYMNLWGKYKKGKK